MKKLIILLIGLISLLSIYGQEWEGDNLYIRDDGQIFFNGVPMDWDSVMDSINAKVAEGAFVQPIDTLTFDTLTEQTTFSTPYTIYPDTANGTFSIRYGESEFLNQLSQEINLYGYNNTGSTLENFEVVYVDTCDCEPRGYKRAIASSREIVKKEILVVTHDIEADTKGYAIRFGEATGNTSMWNRGDVLYLSAVDSGKLTNIPPLLPYYPMPLAQVRKVGVTDGIIEINADRFTGIETGVASEGIFNGIVIQKQAIRDTVIGGTVYFETYNEENDTMNLPFMAGGLLYTLNTTTNTGTNGYARVALTLGTESTPQSNYIYIDNSSTPTLTVSTTAFPNDAIRLAECGVYDLTNHNNYGFAYFQRFNNALDGSESQGWVSRAAQRIRLNGSVWESGNDPTVARVANAAGKDSLNISVNAGIIWQFNRQISQALTEKKYYWFNCPSGGKWINDLHEVDSTSDGEALHIVNNTRYGLNIFYVQNSGGFNDLFLVAAPSGSYTSDDNAINDVTNYSITTAPVQS